MTPSNITFGPLGLDVVKAIDLYAATLSGPVLQQICPSLPMGDGPILLSAMQSKVIGERIDCEPIEESY